MLKGVAAGSYQHLPLCVELSEEKDGQTCLSRVRDITDEEEDPLAWKEI